MSRSFVHQFNKCYEEGVVTEVLRTDGTVHRIFLCSKYGTKCSSACCREEELVLDVETQVREAEAKAGWFPDEM